MPKCAARSSLYILAPLNPTLGQHKDMIHRILILLSVILPTAAYGNDGFLINCEGTPKEAVTELPAPLNKWASLACTKYGHVIGPAEKWLWTVPGGFSPIFVPSQMVKTNPKKVGNSSYFTQIKLIKEKDNSLLGELLKGFDTSGANDTTDIYKLTVKNNQNLSQTLYFIDDRTDSNKWGVWCRNECKETTQFMLLDMSKAPKRQEQVELAPPDLDIKDHNQVIKHLASKNGCIVDAEIKSSKSAKGTEIFEVSCSGSLEKYECEFKEDTFLDRIGVPMNKPEGKNYVNPACWRI